MKRLVALIFATTSALAVAQLPDYVPTEGLVAWYSFDSTLIDSGPNGNDGQSESYAFAQDVFGLAAGALRLELGEYVNLGMEIRLLNTGQDSLSIAFWSKPDENGEIIISKYVNFDAAQSSWLIRDGESTGVRAIGNGEDGNDVVWNLSCPNSTSGWSHIAIVYHPGKVFVWVNGNFICESPVPNSDVTNPQPILVGRSNCNGAFCNDASGLIDNLGFWDRALTATEVQQIASGTPTMGCTDSDACNYDAAAIIDNGTCASCETLATACGEGTIWNAESGTCIVANPSDSNFDGCVQLNDLLDLLSAYGDCGAEESPWQCGDPLEYQGYEYETVQIGEQCWFAENLRAENYRNGDDISTNLSDEDWVSVSYGASSIYGSADSNCDSEVPEFDACNEEDSFSEFGRLYNWYAVIDERSLCPDGWLVPADADWMILETALGVPELELNVKGDRGTDEALGLKSVNGWSDQNGDNSLGLAIKPSGARTESDGRYYGAGWVSYIWSSTQNGSQSWYRRFNNGNAMIGREDASPPDGLAVRCIKDAE